MHTKHGNVNNKNMKTETALKQLDEMLERDVKYFQEKNARDSEKALKSISEIGENLFEMEDALETEIRNGHE